MEKRRPNAVRAMRTGPADRMKFLLREQLARAGRPPVRIARSPVMAARPCVSHEAFETNSRPSTSHEASVAGAMRTGPAHRTVDKGLVVRCRGLRICI